MAPGEPLLDLAQLPSSETIYIRNLNERIPLAALKRDLELLFSKYGSKEVIAHKNIRMRGQAFIVFDETADAERALKDLQGYPFEEKPMVLQFARKKSDRTIRRTDPDAFDAHREARVAAKVARGPLKASVKTAGVAKNKTTTKKNTQKPIPAADGNPPHKVLFIQNLPEDITVDVMQAIFGRYADFRDVRMVPGRTGIAFVEYENDESAISAKEGTSGMTLSGQQLKVSYGKKA